MRGGSAGTFRSLPARGPARLLAAVLLVLPWLASGCGDGASTYGEMGGEAQEIDIESLLEAPELHLGKEVRVSGHVAQVCQEMGCWFEIAQDERRLMIDLQMGRQLTIPESSAGLWAAVDGTFVRQDGVLKVIGRGVELREAPGP